MHVIGCNIYEIEEHYGVNGMSINEDKIDLMIVDTWFKQWV